MVIRLAYVVLVVAGAVPTIALAETPGSVPAAAPDPATPTAKASAEPPEPRVPTDIFLGRVLRSGCHSGLQEVENLIGDPEAPWAETVVRVCRRILTVKAELEAEALVPGVPAGGLAKYTRDTLRYEDNAAQAGRGRLVLWSSLYGIWLGIATDVLFNIDGDRTIVVAPLLGLGAGMALSLGLTSGMPISTGQAWAINTGMDYGSIHGALWAGSLDLSYAGTAGTAVASSIAATTIAIAVAEAKRPRAGTLELIRSSLLWGTVGGTLGLAAFASDSSISQEAAFRSVALTMDLSFLIGLALAKNVTISRNRVLIIDAGALGGAVTGLGLAWLSVSNPGSEGRFIAAGGLIGMLAGIGIAAYATRELDDEDDAPAAIASAVPPGVLALHPDGRWRVGAPGPVPVFDGTGRRLVGATLNALSGSF